MEKLDNNKHILISNNIHTEFGDFKQSDTYKHTIRVAHITKLLGEKLGLSEDEINRLFEIAPYHDIGKIKIDDSLLYSHRKLTNDEFEKIKEHTIHGYEILRENNCDILDEAAIVALQHHEKYDGSGYPYGLKGEDIHLSARIIAVADVIDALLSKRSYKEQWTISQVINHFEDKKGIDFDPHISNIVINNIECFYKVHNSLS